MQADASAQTLLHRVRGGQRLFRARITPEAVIPRDSMITLKGKNLVILDEEKLKTFRTAATRRAVHTLQQERYLGSLQQPDV